MLLIRRSTEDAPSRLGAHAGVDAQVHAVRVEVQTALIVERFVASRNGTGVHELLVLPFRLNCSTHHDQAIKPRRRRFYRRRHGHGFVRFPALLQVLRVLLLVIDKPGARCEPLVAIVECAHVFMHLAYI